MNFGALISIASGGFFARYLSYHDTFIIAAGMTLLACISLLIGNRFIHYASTAPTHHVYQNPFKRLSLYIGISVIVGLIGWGMLNHYIIADWILSFVAVAVIILLLLMAWCYAQKLRRQIILFLILCLASLIFFTIYIMEPSVLTLFIAHNVDRTIAHFTIPASSFYSLDPLFVIVLGLIMRHIWYLLKSRNRMPSKLNSFGLGLCIMGGRYSCPGTGHFLT